MISHLHHQKRAAVHIWTEATQRYKGFILNNAALSHEETQALPLKKTSVIPGRLELLC